MAFPKTYPPQWAGKYPSVSPSYKYSNIYNLDELDVYYEDDPLDPIFFNISGLPDRLPYGKTWFTISFNDSEDTALFLKENSSVLFEFKDSNGTVLYSDLTNYNDINGAAIAYVWLKVDPLISWDVIEEGFGTLTIVGELDNVPAEWQGVYNTRLTIPIDIRKNLPNIGPILFQSSSLIQSAIGFSENISTDISNTVYQRSYTKVSASYLHTYGGEVKFFDLLRKRAKGFDAKQHERRMIYIRKVLKNGFDFDGTIRVRYGSIHKVKGTTFDNVVGDLSIFRRKPEPLFVQKRLKYVMFSRGIYDAWVLRSETGKELGDYGNIR